MAGYIYRPVRRDPPIGLLISEVDPQQVYLAIPDDLWPPGEPVGLMVPHECLERIRDCEGDWYAAVRWTPDFDRKWTELIDLMIELRHAHPSLVQLRLFDLLMVP